MMSHILRLWVIKWVIVVFGVGVASAEVVDRQVLERIEVIKNMSFENVGEAGAFLKELDGISNNPQVENALRYFAARTSYKINASLFSYAEALRCARVSQNVATDAEERAEAAVAIAKTLLSKPRIAQDEQEIRNVCENAVAALNAFIEFAKTKELTPKIIDGARVSITFDPYLLLFRHVDLLSSFSNYLSAIGDHEGAWEKMAETIALSSLSPKYFPDNYIDSFHLQQFNNSIMAGRYQDAATLVLWAFKHEKLSEKKAVGMLNTLAQLMVKTGKLIASDVFSAAFPLKDDPMIAFMFQSVVAKEFYAQEKYIDASELTKHNLAFVSKRMMAAADANNKEIFEEMKKTQYDMLELLGSSYYMAGNFDAATSVGNLTKKIREDNEKKLGTGKSDKP